MTVRAECLACRTPLDTRDGADGGTEARRRCACPFKPGPTTWARLPAKRDDPKAGLVELVKAWRA
jgi:hypothetical protein